MSISISVIEYIDMILFMIFPYYLLSVCIIFSDPTSNNNIGHVIASIFCLKNLVWVLPIVTEGVEQPYGLHLLVFTFLSELLPSSADVTYDLFLISCCSVAQSCLTLCDPMDWSTPGFPVLPYLLEFTQTHVYWVGDAI